MSRIVNISPVLQKYADYETFSGHPEYDDGFEAGVSHMVDELENLPIKEAEWIMVMDDFDDGLGNRELPHCSSCHRGVYRHDAGSWCPFCGASMKNAMR